MKIPKIATKTKKLAPVAGAEFSLGYGTNYAYDKHTQHAAGKKQLKIEKALNKGREPNKGRAPQKRHRYSTYVD